MQIIIIVLFSYQSFKTQERRQSNTDFTIDERGSIIARNNVFDYHLSPVGRQMAIKTSVSNDCFLSTFVDSIIVFDCLLSDVIKKTGFRQI